MMRRAEVAIPASPLPEETAELPDEVGLFGDLEEDLGGTERAARAAKHRKA